MTTTLSRLVARLRTTGQRRVLPAAVLLAGPLAASARASPAPPAKQRILARRRRDRSIRVRAIGVVLFAIALHWPTAVRAEAAKVALQVVCDDRAAGDQISSAIRTRMMAAGLRIDSPPFKKLIVYVQRDVDDTINPDGWTVAIAHVSNQQAYFVASKLLSAHGPEIDEARPALIGMIQEDGFLTYLNTAHLTRLDARSVAILADNLVTELIKRLPR